MTGDALPERVLTFLRSQIFSASQLDVLLHVRAAGGSAVTAADVSRELRLPVGSIVPWLDAFVSRGLLAREGDAYRYAPVDDTVDGDLTAVAEVYARRPVSVTRRIYGSGEDPLTRFADAFRLRRDPRPGKEG